MTGALAVACGGSGSGEPRAQVLLVVDTDAHVSGELDTRDDVSADATVDVLRVDLLDGDGSTNTFVVGDPAAWPVSFGVVRGAAPTTTLRLRLFRALFADPGTVGGTSVLDPPPQVTIDRIVSLPMPDSGVTRLEVLLTEDCLGVPSSFLAPRTTCVDGAHLAGGPSDGLVPVGPDIPASQVGTWAPGVDVPCASSPSGDRVCVPGGFDIMGNAASVGILYPLLDPLPYRPTLVSPFVLDRHEMTVARFRALVTSGKYTGALPTLEDPSSRINQNCNWLGPNDPGDDDQPLNCIDHDSAEQVCAAFGGTLPTEAQWNRAARGRGQHRVFPWGDQTPNCCTESFGRAVAKPSACSGVGPEPVGSHLPSPACGGIGDVSRDGIIDMGGNVSEAVLDDLERYDGPCWTSAAILVDPVCKSVDSIGSVARGGDWDVGVSNTIAPVRWGYVAHPAFGLRCAYADVP